MIIEYVTDLQSNKMPCILQYMGNATIYKSDSKKAWFQLKLNIHMYRLYVTVFVEYFRQMQSGHRI